MNDPFIRALCATMASGSALFALAGMGSVQAEIVIQVYPKIQHLPAEQILSESGIGMTRWGQALQRLPNQRKLLTIPGQPAAAQRTRHLKIAYLYVAATSASHTAGRGDNTQTGAITADTQADAARHELWHIEVARAAAAKANELETKLLAVAFPGSGSGSSAAPCHLQMKDDADTMSRIDQAVLKRFQALKEKYNTKLHAISFAGVVNGVWRDNPAEDTSSQVLALLADLNAEPIEEEVTLAENKTS